MAYGVSGFGKSGLTNLDSRNLRYTRRLLTQAAKRKTPMGSMRIISVEGLIGFKLQGFVNDATRTRDLDDIRALLKVRRTSLNIDELRESFALFNKPEPINELLD